MKKYLFLSIFFILLSVVGGLLLIKNNKKIPYEDSAISSLSPTKIPTFTPTPFSEVILPVSASMAISPTITSRPTLTPRPSSTPHPSIIPSPTTIDISDVSDEPSPTRILLPVAGVEFPSQVLTIIGGIVTLLGFLILL
jgi:hypothetical protein